MHGVYDAYGDYEESIDDEYYDENVTGYNCYHCDTAFSSNNKLHTHVRTYHTIPHSDINTTQQASIVSMPQTPAAPDPKTHTAPQAKEIIESIPSNLLNRGFAFRGRNYVTAKAHWNDISTSPRDTCLDTGSSTTLICRNEVKALNVTVSQSKEPLTLRGIGTATYTLTEYVRFPLFFEAKRCGMAVLVKVMIEAYITDNLRAGLLLGTDIMVPHGIVLNLGTAHATVASCPAAAIPLQVAAKPHRITSLPVYNKSRITIPAHSHARLPVLTSKAIPTDRDAIFTPEYKHLTLYSHVVDSNFSFIHAVNLSDKPVTIPRKVRLGTLSDMEDVNACLVSPNAAALARTEQDNIKYKSPGTMSKDDDNERKLPNGVTVWGDDVVAQKLAQMVNKYPEIWGDPGGFVNVPEDQWLRIPLVYDWQDRVKKARLGRIYPQGPKERAVIDRTFDRLHSQGRMEWSQTHSPTGYPVFVVWRPSMKNGIPIQKGRVVVDVRDFNPLVVPDIYPIPLQADILASLAGKKFITVVDAMAFFYQWRTHPDDRHFLTVVSHRGQEVFNVAVMGFINSVAYVQRQLENLLREFRHFLRVYVDDIILFSDILEDHLHHLDQLFARLKELNIWPQRKPI